MPHGTGLIPENQGIAPLLTAIGRGEGRLVRELLETHFPTAGGQRRLLETALSESAGRRMQNGRSFEDNFEIPILIRIGGASGLVTVAVQATRVHEAAKRKAYAQAVIGPILEAFVEAESQSDPRRAALLRTIIVGLLHETFKEGTRARPEERAQVLHEVLARYPQASVTYALVDGFVNHSVEIISEVTRKKAIRRDPRSMPAGVADHLALLSLDRIVRTAMGSLHAVENRQFSEISNLPAIANMLSYIWSDQQWFLLDQNTQVCGHPLQHWSREAYAAICALGSRIPRYFSMLCEQLRTLVETSDAGDEPPEFIERCFAHLFKTARELGPSTPERELGINDLARMLKARGLPATWSAAAQTQLSSPENWSLTPLVDAALEASDPKLFETGLQVVAHQRAFSTAIRFLSGHSPFPKKQRCALALLRPPSSQVSLQASPTPTTDIDINLLLASLSSCHNATDALPILGGLLAIARNFPEIATQRESAIIEALALEAPFRGSASHARQNVSSRWQIVHSIQRHKESQLLEEMLAPDEPTLRAASDSH